MNGWILRHYNDGATIGHRLVHYNGKTFHAHRLVRTWADRSGVHNEVVHFPAVFVSATDRYPRTFGMDRAAVIARAGR